MANAARKMTSSEDAPARPPAHQIVYQALREQILFGEIAPGQPLTIQGLTERLQAGMTPVREAIRRLTAEGALNFQGNRRVVVPLLDSENIEEIIGVRSFLEAELAKRAASRINPDDLAELIRLDTQLDTAISKGDLTGYLENNYRFHAKIYAVANAPILTDLAEGLWLRFGPSLRVVCGRIGTQNLPDKHKDLLEAFQAGDEDAAAKANLEDMLQGMDQIRRMLG